MSEILYKPIVYQIPAFDSKDEITLFFSYVGSTLLKNTILVRDNLTNQEVYENTLTTMQLKNIIPANTLKNGNIYNVSIKVFDNNGNSSPFSDEILIYCFTQPKFSFINLKESQIISSSNYQVELSYIQPEKEVLNQYSIILYNSNKMELFNSGNIYNTENLSYLVSNLINGDFYYIRATGITIHNMIVDTGYISFSVRYLRPPVFSLLGLENKPHVGSISITPNIITIEGTSNPKPPKFINNKEVDLRDENSYVTFDKGFNIQNDFVIQLIGRDFRPYKEIITISNGYNKVEIKYMIGKFDGYKEKMAYFQLRAYNNLTNYFLTSNYLEIPSSEEKIYLWIKRNNNSYELICENIGK